MGSCLERVTDRRLVAILASRKHPDDGGGALIQTNFKYNIALILFRGVDVSTSCRAFGSLFDKVYTYSSCSRIVHMGKSSNVAPVASEPSLIFPIDVCNRFCHT